MDEHHAALAEDAAVAVVHAVDGGVVLVVRAGREQRENELVAHAFAGLVRRRIARHGVCDEGGLALRVGPYTFAGGVAQAESAGLGDAFVEVEEVGEDLFDFAANQCVVLDQLEPIHAALGGQRGVGQSGHDGGLRQQVLGRRWVDALGDVDHAHRVFDRDALRATRLHIDFGAAQTRQDQCLASVHHVAAVELGGDVHRQVAALQGLPGFVGVWRGGGEVSAEGEEDLAVAVAHLFDRAHHVHAGFARRLEAVDVAQLVEQGGRWLFPDAHGAIALHIAVTADRARARAGSADIAAQQEQVHDHLDRRDRMRVLRDAHAPAGDHALGADVDVAGAANLRLRESGLLF